MEIIRNKKDCMKYLPDKKTQMKIVKKIENNKIVDIKIEYIGKDEYNIDKEKNMRESYIIDKLWDDRGMINRYIKEQKIENNWKNTTDEVIENSRNDRIEVENQTLVIDTDTGDEQWQRKTEEKKEIEKSPVKTRSQNSRKISADENESNEVLERIYRKTAERLKIQSKKMKINKVALASALIEIGIDDIESGYDEVLKNIIKKNMEF